MLIVALARAVLIPSFVVTLAIVVIVRSERPIPAATYREPSGAVPRETFHHRQQSALFIAREREKVA